MKKLILALSTVLAFSSVSAYGAETKAQGVGDGKHGDVTVEVTFDSGKIKNIDVLRNEENKVLTKHVFTDMKDNIIKYNSVSVDGVAGATVSSNALKQAVQGAADKAGVKLSTERVDTGVVLDIPQEQSFDVVVIGAGGAGLAAAIEVAQAGKSVVILEKMAGVGGNSSISGADMNAADNWAERHMGVLDDTAYLHYQDTMKGGDNLSDPALVRVMTDNALTAAEWLRDDIKVEFMPDFAYQFGGHTKRRSLVPVAHTGAGVIGPMNAYAEKAGVKIITNMKAEELIIDDNGRVVGVKGSNGGKTYTFNAKNGVIIATGGFGANMEMRKKYNPFYDEKFLTTDLPGTTGDGHMMAEKIGAELVGMEHIQVYPISDPITGALELVSDGFMDGGIVVNKDGKRFVEELQRRDVISRAILEQPEKYSFVVWGKDVEDRGKYTTAHADEYAAFTKSGIMFTGDTLEELAAKAGIDPKGLAETAKKVGEYAKTGKDLDFNNRVGLSPLDKGPFYAIKAVPSVHYTMGGIRIDTRSRVMKADGKIIPGLYAAGEVTGGIHGTNRLGGNAYAEIMVFGRIAGQEAAANNP